MNRSRNLKPVPNTHQVIGGASVNIVLKEDQPTGRTVSGVVRDVLTRGNHPRGIKVRLADGRVGRVQTMASPGQTVATTSAQGSVNGIVGGMQGVSLADTQSYEAETSRRPRRQGGGWSQQLDEEDFPSQQIGLDAYMKPARTKKAGKGKSAKTAAADPGDTDQDESRGGAAVEPSATESQTVTCPVCEVFEGDEAAVAHHVASHFESEC